MLSRASSISFILPVIMPTSELKSTWFITLARNTRSLLLSVSVSQICFICNAISRRFEISLSFLASLPPPSRLFISLSIRSFSCLTSAIALLAFSVSPVFLNSIAISRFLFSRSAIFPFNSATFALSALSSCRIFSTCPSCDCMRALNAPKVSSPPRLSAIMDISSLTYLGGCFNLSFLLGITAILPQSLATVLASSRYLSDLPVSIKRAASSRQLFKSPAIFSAFSPAAVLPTSITPDKISASAASFSLLFSRYSICLSSTVVKISPSVLSETMVSIASAEDSIYSFNAFLASLRDTRFREYFRLPCSSAIRVWQAPLRRRF